MFTNIGKKIKVLAVVIFCIMAGLSLISGLIMIAEGFDYGHEDFIFGGIIIAGLGFLFSWISSFVLYAYGEIADKVSAIEYNTRGLNGAQPTFHQPPVQPQYGQAPFGQPPVQPQYGQAPFGQPQYGQPSFAQTPVQPEPSQVAPDVRAQRIASIENLKAQGVISEEEYRNLLAQEQ